MSIKKTKKDQTFQLCECDVILFHYLAGTGVNRIIGGDESDTTHYIDGKYSDIQPSKDFRKTMLSMIDKNENNKK